MRAVIAMSLMIGAVFLPKVALAQDGPKITPSNVITRLGPDGKEPKNDHPEGLQGTSINYEDCIQDNVLRIGIQTTLTSSYSFEVWAGTNCTDTTARSGASGSTCWPVRIGNPTQANAPMDIRVQDIVAHYYDTTKPATYSAAGPDACSPDTAATSSVTVQLTFLWLSGTTVGNSALLPPTAAQTAAGNTTGGIEFDLLGPAAPGGTSVGIDNTRLVARWTPTTDQDTRAYRVYCRRNDACAPSVVDAGSDATDTGVADSAVVDDTGIGDTGASAQSDALSFGGDMHLFAALDGGGYEFTGADVCGRADSISSSEAIITGLPDGTPLENYKTYELSVVSVDRFGNLGEAGSIFCGTPSRTTDFWDAYRQAGGDAGGCSTSDSAGGSLLAIAFVPIAMMVGRIRRKRNRA